MLQNFFRKEKETSLEEKIGMLKKVFGDSPNLYSGEGCGEEFYLKIKRFCLDNIKKCALAFPFMFGSLVLGRVLRNNGFGAYSDLATLGFIPCFYLIYTTHRNRHIAKIANEVYRQIYCSGKSTENRGENR